MSHEVNETLEESLTKTLDSLGKQLMKVRTGRASASMLDDISVSYYGSNTPINQVASLSMPEPRLIIVQPYDKQMLVEIERAIHQSRLGISPMNDGNVIRLPIPALTEESRKEIAKEVRKIGEETKVSMRKHRKTAIDAVKGQEKDKVVSEDDSKKLQAEIQKVVDNYTVKIDDATRKKEQEVTSI